MKFSSSDIASGIAIVAGIVAYVPTIPDLLLKNAKGKTRMKRHGYWFTAAVLLLMFLPIIQDNIHKGEEKEHDAEQAESLDHRDSVNRVAFDSSLKVQSTTYAKVLAGYGYKFDSTGKKLESLLKDSIHNGPVEIPTIAVGTYGNEPGIFEKSRSGFIANLQINFNSYDAASNGFNIKSDIIRRIGETLIYMGKSNMLENTETIPKNSNLTLNFNVDIDSVDFVYFWVRGTYKGMGSGKVYKIDDIYFYNVTGRSNGRAIGKLRTRIVNLVNSKRSKKS